MNSNAPEPSESIVTVGETPNSSDDGVMPISETENPTEVVTSEEEVVEGADNVEDQVMEIDAGVDEYSRLHYELLLVRRVPKYSLQPSDQRHLPK